MTNLPLHDDMRGPGSFGPQAISDDGYSLRVSLLSQCNFSCPYCLPGAVQPYEPKQGWLSPAQYGRLAEIFREVGVYKVRFTGGEPLLRDDIDGIARAFRSEMPEATLAVTTNGTRLADRMKDLKAAGISQVTVHLDTLRQERYGRLMGPGDVTSILSAIGDATGIFSKVKINTVVQRGQNDDELVDFLELSDKLGVEVRFIELMNTGSAKEYVRDVFISGAECIRIVQDAAGLVEKIERRRASDPAALYQLRQSGVTFGVIASDTDPFCTDCDRLRLTATGRLRGCLYQGGGTTLGDLVRLDASKEQLLAVVRAAIGDKRSFHPLAGVAQPPFSMADIGG